MAPKLAVLPTLFLLLGSVASQGFNGAPSASPTAAPVPRRVLSPMHAPSSNAPPAYPPRGAAARPSSSAAAPPVYDPVASSPGPSAASPVSGPTSSSAAPPVYDPVASSPGPSAASPVSGPTSSSAAPPVYPVAPSPGPSASSPVSGPTSSSAAPPVYPVASSPGPSASSPVSGPTAVPNQPPSPGPAPAGLRVGYYSYSCPNAEAIVREAVKSAAASNPGIGAGLIRLLFHDCFVHGCDASVLLNTTGSAAPTERQSPPNLSLRGFEVIDAAKAALEAACPGVVSCADVVAFAGRDATYFLSGNAVDFGMPAGRYDGRVSLSSEALDNLPPPTADLKTLKDMFEAKGLDTDDMVTLSGAHTVGVSHCSSFSDRIPPNNASSDSMNPTLAASLGQQCGGGGDPTVVQDLVTPNKLDSQYYWNVLNHDVLFTSDAALLASNQTADMVSANAFTPGLWETKFKAAMVKMGSVGIKTSADGEIREKCWMIN